MNPIKTTPKDFFLHLGATITLYISLIALVNLSFSIINYLFPDTLAGYFFANSIAWPISMLVVLVPIFCVLEWLIKKDIKLLPEKGDLWIQKWRIFLTLFLTGAVIAGDLIALINTYLNGEISTRFVYKFLVILVVLAIVFAYYILEKIHKATLTKTILASAGIIIVLAAIVGGFLVVGSPTKQRNIRFDTQRVSDLQNIQWQVVNYWQQKEKLPSTLASTTDPLYGNVIPADPETRAAYEYSMTGPLSFELCASFALPYEDMRGKGGYGGSIAYPSIDMSYPSYGGIDDNWKHDAGHACFVRTIDPEKYPKIVR